MRAAPQVFPGFDPVMWSIEKNPPGLLDASKQRAVAGGHIYDCGAVMDACGRAWVRAWEAMERKKVARVVGGCCG